MRSMSVALLFFAALLLAGCASSSDSTEEAASEAAVEALPDWMVDTPEDADYLLGAATSTSDDLQVAVDKATMQARSDIAGQIEARFEGLTRQFEEEVGATGESELLEQFTQVQQEVVSETLRGANARDQKVITDDGRYRAYVLVELPVGQAAEDFLQQLSDEDYTRLRQSEAFDVLREEIERLEEENE